MNEGAIWKLIAWILGLILTGSLLLNALSPVDVPGQITLFNLGCLVSIAVGYSVVSNNSSPSMNTDQTEKGIRKQQYAAGLVISLVLSLILVFSDVPDARLLWLLLPIILLSPFLIVREYVVKVLKDR